MGRIMLRLLTGYSQYYNRKYRKMGHVSQGRHVRQDFAPDVENFSLAAFADHSRTR
jgi:hypothetical protein